MGNNYEIVKDIVNIVFGLNKDNPVEINEKTIENNITTEIVFNCRDGHLHKYSINKRAESITYKDIKRLKRLDNLHSSTGIGRFIYRFFIWWIGFTGLYVTFSVCPICGQVNCPVGIAGATAIGGFFALFVQNWKALFKTLKERFLKR